MSVADTEPRRVFLLPGTLYCAEEPTVISTILGSCIAVCLWDGVRRLGGMNHFVLPLQAGRPRDDRYGDIAIDDLITGMERIGARRRSLVAKVFGGAAVLAADTPYRAVGMQNLAMALDRLKANRIPVVARRTGGKLGRLVRFSTDRGDAFVRRVAPPVF